MAWRVIEVSDDETKAEDLTDGELVGIRVLLIHNCGEPHDERYNVYYRAYCKLETQAEKALENA